MAGRGRQMVQPAWMTAPAAPGAPFEAAAPGERQLAAPGAPPGANGVLAAAPRAGAAGEEGEARGHGHGHGHGLDWDKKSKKSKKSGKEKKDKKERKHKRSSRHSDSDSSSDSDSDSRGHSRKRGRRDGSPEREQGRSGPAAAAAAPRVPSKLRGPSMWDRRPEDIAALPPPPQSAPQRDVAWRGAAPAGGTPAPAVAYAYAAINPANMKATRHARRLYVGGIDQVSEAELKQFFDEAVRAALSGDPVHGPGAQVVSVYVNPDKKFGFLELNSVDLASSCLLLDGIEFRGIGLKIKRPNDYRPEQAPPPGASMPQIDLSKVRFAAGSGGFGGGGGHRAAPGGGAPGGGPVLSNHIADSPNKIFVGGIPHHLTELQILELLEAFGKLRALKVIKDAQNGTSKGYAFCEWVDPGIVETAVASLNGLAIGDRTLTVRRSEPLPPAAAAALAAAAAAAAVAAGAAARQQPPAATAAPPTPVLVLLNMVTKEELADDREYQEIIEDIKEEAGTHGHLVSLEIPRPAPAGLHVSVPGLEKVFLRYNTSAEAMAARAKLEGRTFANRTVQCDFLDVQRYERLDF
jgi:splicing factor U2AF subunit